MRRTINRIYFQQRLFEFVILTLPFLQDNFVELRVMLYEVLRPAIQLPQNVVQPFDEICPVVSHPDSAEIPPNQGTHLVNAGGQQ